MKKIIPVISAFLAIVVVVFISFLIFRNTGIESVEIIGDVQTIYFVDSTNTVNFNDAGLKIKYKDGTVKLKKLSYKNVSVKNFTTSVANDGIMKITYKSKTIDLRYSVIWTGLYYLSEKTDYSFNGTSISSKNSGKYVAGVDSSNRDKTTSVEMIYFHKDGTCDYYTRSSETASWFMDDGTYDKSFNYTINGGEIIAQLGKDKTYSLRTKVSNDGELSLVVSDNKYVTQGDVSFLKTRTDKEFQHYEMKGNRTIVRGDVSAYCSSTISFPKNSSFSDSNLKIYAKVTYKNDNFLKTVYVRFTEAMFISDKEFSTKVTTPSSTAARCYYDGVYFELIYKVV